jgi:hypothetical protein
MDLMIQSQVIESVEGGVRMDVTAEDLHVQAYVVIAPADFSIVEKLIPTAVFESGVQIHVASVDQASDITEQIVQILENMQPEDVVAYLCDSAISYGEALAVLGLRH